MAASALSGELAKALIQSAYCSFAAGMSPFQPWQKKKTLVTLSAFAFSIRRWLIRPPGSVTSAPSASKLINPYWRFVPEIVSNPMAFASQLHVIFNRIQNIINSCGADV